jgi:hypothetical protein
MLERAQHRRDFHQIRPGTHYMKNVHAKVLTSSVLSPGFGSIVVGNRISA